MNSGLLENQCVLLVTEPGLYPHTSKKIQTKSEKKHGGSVKDKASIILVSQNSFAY